MSMFEFNSKLQTDMITNVNLLPCVFQEILCMRCLSLNVLMREDFYHSQFGPDSLTLSHVRVNHQGDHHDNQGATLNSHHPEGVENGRSGRGSRKNS